MSQRSAAEAIYERALIRLTRARTEFQQWQVRKDDHTPSASEAVELAFTAVITANALLSAAQVSLQAPSVGQLETRHVAAVLLELQKMREPSEGAIRVLAMLGNALKASGGADEPAV